MCRKGVDIMYRVKRFWDTNIDEYEYFIQNIKNKEIIAVTSNKDDADKIVKALEKQIPKQVQYLDRNEGYFECGACKGAIYNSSDDLEDHIYCLLCGQRVDWS